METLTDFLKPSIKQRQKRRDKRLYQELTKHPKKNKCKVNHYFNSIKLNDMVEDITDTLPFVQGEYSDTRLPEYRDSKINTKLIRKFLMKHIGQPWDKIYAEFSQKVPKHQKLSDEIYYELHKYATGKAYKSRFFISEAGILGFTPQQKRKQEYYVLS